MLANGFKIAGKGPMAGGIDYAFVTNGFDVVGHQVGPTLPSDHPSFYVDLMLREQRPLRVLCWNVLWTNFGAGKEDLRTNLATVMVDTMMADVAG